MLSMVFEVFSRYRRRFRKMPAFAKRIPLLFSRSRMVGKSLGPLPRSRIPDDEVPFFSQHPVLLT